MNGGVGDREGAQRKNLGMADNNHCSNNLSKALGLAITLAEATVPVGPSVVTIAIAPTIITAIVTATTIAAAAWRQES